MSDVYRVLEPSRNGEHSQPETVPLDVYLDGLENRRGALIMELRWIDQHLVRYGRLKTETLSRRIR